MIEYEGVTFRWLGHDGFVITSKEGKSVCIDPFRVKGDLKPVDVLISTHEHFDHCSVEDMQKVVSSDTEVIGIPMAEDNLSQLTCKKIHYVKPGDTLTVKSIPFEFVPAYNVNKFRSPNVPFHPKEDGKIGVIMVMDSHRIYHAGDTDYIPEMANFRPDIALIPVSGTYVMTAEEAIEAAGMLQPKLIIPMHFGAIVGDSSMAEKLKQSISIPVEIPRID
jgi:L-ascorbate metabolism protein UlaG (beta-lactamase superfamily)